MQLKLNALPRFALSTGIKCASCHINPTGGQMRNQYGTNTYSMEELPLESTFDSEFTFDPKISDNITIGSDFRSQYLADEFTHTSTFQAMAASVYASVNLTKKATFYYKQDIVNGTYGSFFPGTEVFALVKGLPANFYAKGGIFLPDFGWRIDDHTGYTRGGDLGYTSAGYHPGLFFVPNYKDIGLEIGNYFDDFFITVGIFNGTGHTNKLNFSKEKSVSAKIEYANQIFSHNYRVGISNYSYKNFTMQGVNFGIGTEDLTFLAEIDWAKNQLDINTYVITEKVRSLAAFAEIDYRIMQGLWFVGKYDLFDPQQGVKDDVLKRVNFGVEFFPMSFIELRPFYRFNIEKPEFSNNQFVLQMHVWF